ncbi:MAG: thiamine pyrophosphate-dependent enzyme, partial [Mariprofundus sp.]|nr:thiamine pyrophosphate-dependent enzyme [Mariprofundus sp.]
MSQSKQIQSTIDDDLFSAGGSYLEQLYEQYQRDPASLPSDWAEYFSGLSGTDTGKSPGHREMLERMAPVIRSASAPVEHHVQNDIEYPSRAFYLIHGYRIHGHLHADLDPLHLDPRPPSPELELGYYGLSEQDLDNIFPVGDLAGGNQMRLRDIIAVLSETYCGHIGPEFMHITDSARKHWIQKRLERLRSTPDYDADRRKHIFERVMHAEEFERFLHTRYVGQKRFSLEGGESLIPMLDTLIQRSGKHGAKEIILGMAHRGRLNVLANIMGKSLSEIFSEFEGAQLEEAAQGQGDVKYHLGFSSDVHTAGGIVHVSLGFNPSHLEIITPVAMGSVRARQCRRKDKTKRE